MHHDDHGMRGNAGSKAQIEQFRGGRDDGTGHVGTRNGDRNGDRQWTRPEHLRAMAAVLGVDIAVLQVNPGEPVPDMVNMYHGADGEPMRRLYSWADEVLPQLMAQRAPGFAGPACCCSSGTDSTTSTHCCRYRV